MPSIYAVPADAPPSPVAAETRMVHDVATLRPSDYRSADGASWVISVITPAADSGARVTGSTYFDTAKGQTVPVPDARRRYANRGTWQVVASSSPAVPATGRYDWLTLAWLRSTGGRYRKRPSICIRRSFAAARSSIVGIRPRKAASSSATCG